MAFQTIPGTGGAPDSYVGTSGVDSVLITDNNNAVDLIAYGSNDVVTIANAIGVVNGYTLRGGSGNDVFTTNTTTFADAGFLNGNAGNDVITLNAFNAVSVTSASVRGGQGNDTIAMTGSTNGSLVNGNMDDDTITTAGASNSSIYGGQGVDTLNINGVTVLTVVNGDRDDDTINVGTTAASRLSQSSVYGGDGSDTININANLTVGNDSFILGGNGNDTITSGSAVALTLSGEAGNDSITGGTGNDTLIGGTGADLLTAGAGGNDTFVFAAGDSFASTGTAGTTANFNNGVDVIVGLTTVNGAGDSAVLPGRPLNVPDVNWGQLGTSASIVGGQVFINPGTALQAGLNRFYVAGNAAAWNQATRVFTNNGGGANPGDYMLFQVTLAAPIPALVAAQDPTLNITNLFNTAEVVILDNANFT